MKNAKVTEYGIAVIVQAAKEVGHAADKYASAQTRARGACIKAVKSALEVLEFSSIEEAQKGMHEFMTEFLAGTLETLSAVTDNKVKNCIREARKYALRQGMDYLSTIHEHWQFRADFGPANRGRAGGLLWSIVVDYKAIKTPAGVSSRVVPEEARSPAPSTADIQQAHSGELLKAALVLHAEAGGELIEFLSATAQAWQVLGLHNVKPASNPVIENRLNGPENPVVALALHDAQVKALEAMH